MSTNALVHSNLHQRPVSLSSARLSNPGSASSVWAGLTNAASSSSSKAAKPRNNYTPRFVFYRKKRTLFTKKRFFSHKNEKAQHC